METYSSLSARISSSPSRRTRTSSLDGPAASPPAVSVGMRVEQRVDLAAQGAGVGAELGQHGDDDAAVLLEQHAEQVLGRHLRVAAALGELAGRGDGLLGLDGESISLHEEISVGYDVDCSASVDRACAPAPAG